MRALAAAAAVLLLGWGNAVPARVKPKRAVTAVPVKPQSPPDGMQYLYGSGEGAALSMQAFAALLDHARGAVAHRPVDSVVLAQGSDLGSPVYVPCGDKPFAAVFDVDETVMLNVGFEYYVAKGGRGYDAAAWDRWEKTGAAYNVAVPGAVYTLDALRGMGVTVVFNTNRSAANADATVAALKATSLGNAVHGTTLFLQGEDDMKGRKDGRRWTIADRYCVIAMAGDQLGDFSDLFNAKASVGQRRNMATETAAQLWGHGWFVLPNPVYGSGLRGGFDDLFPMDKRWGDAPKETR
jgi:5'-nucleotidase (lipoprotein e(P4) family)